MIPPPLGTFGTMGRNIFPDSGFKNIDFSIAKNWHFGEHMRAQFRAEFFNILNHTNFAVPITPDNTDIFDSSGASTGVAGRLTSTTTDSRQIQFALKIVW